MAPDRGHQVTGPHFDRDASERSEFSARRCPGIERGYPPMAVRANGCLFFCKYVLEALTNFINNCFVFHRNA